MDLAAFILWDTTGSKILVSHFVVDIFQNVNKKIKNFSTFFAIFWGIFHVNISHVLCIYVKEY